VLNYTGFRAIGNKLFYTKVIRSSIDRPNITYVLKKILLKKLGEFDYLYFLLKGAAT